MELRLVLAVAIVAVAAATAWWLRRRRPEPPTGTAATVPAQLDRADFDHPGAPWLVVLFSSSTCEGCRPMAEKVQALVSDDVAVAEVEYRERPDLHRRYGIDAVPLVVVADADGVTRASFVGATPASDLWATVAALRAADTPD